MSPEELVAAVAAGRYRVAESNGRLVLRVAATTAAQVIDATWQRLIDGAYRQLTEALR